MTFFEVIKKFLHQCGRKAHCYRKYAVIDKLIYSFKKEHFYSKFAVICETSL